MDLPKPVHHWSDGDNFGFEVVGESHYQDALTRIARSRNTDITALLIPESDNPHDRWAVAVYIHGYKVGHLSRDDARSFRRRLRSHDLRSAATSCPAQIFGGGKNKMYGVWLDMEPFD